jgi:hypothetical protein
VPFAFTATNGISVDIYTLVPAITPDGSEQFDPELGPEEIKRSVVLDGDSR